MKSKNLQTATFMTVHFSIWNGPAHHHYIWSQMVVHVTPCPSVSGMSWVHLLPQMASCKTRIDPYQDQDKKQSLCSPPPLLAITSIQNVGRALRTLWILRVGLELRLVAAVGKHLSLSAHSASYNQYRSLSRQTSLGHIQLERAMGCC